MASIKERAELVKFGLQMDIYSRENSERMKKNALLSAIHNEFKGSEYRGNKVTTADKKFDIIVDDKLNISVIEHTDTLEGEIVLACELLDRGHGEYAIKVMPSMHDDNSVPSYDVWAQAELDKLSTDLNTRQQQLEEIFIKADKWYFCMDENLTDEQLSEINKITSFVDWMSFLEEDCSNIYDLYESYKEENDNSVEEMLINWGYVKPQEYEALCASIITYEKYVQEIIDNLPSNETEKYNILTQYAITSQNYWATHWGEIPEGTVWNSVTDLMNYLGYSYTTLQQYFESEQASAYDNVESWMLDWQILGYKEYMDEYVKTITITCGEESKTINPLEESYAEFWIFDEGEYSVTATASDGSIGNKTVSVKILEKYVTIELENTTSLAENESNETYIWNSSDKSIATVTNGVVKGINPGTAYISLTNEEGTLLSSECRVTVIESTFDTSYGKIDVIWLSGTSNTYSATPNSPETSLGTSRLTPVYWASNAQGEISNTFSENTIELKQGDSGYQENNWYNYTIQTGNIDGKTSRWANGYNQEDGSYFVWIPRFAYRITYYSDETFSNVTGYYDGHGQWNASTGGIRSRLESGIETIEHNGVSYIVHPAFTDCELNLGSWDEDVTGFWFAKYKMGKEEYSNSSWSNTNTSSITNGKVLTDNTSTRVVSKPGIYSWRYIPLGYSYTNGINYNSQMKSHLTKNSEWGAVAYLTHSQYGRNGSEIYTNNNSNKITGEAGETLNATSTTSTYAYNTTNGMNSSSTGNITGIYDLSSITSEWVSVFNETTATAQYSTIDNCSYWTEQTALTPSSQSTKYATHYSGIASGILYSNYNISVFSAGKTGDATKEVSQGGINFITDRSKGYTNWNEDYGGVPRNNICVLI